MRIESSGIYTSNGQIGKVNAGNSPKIKPRQSAEESKKTSSAPQSFSGMLSQAETNQLTKLFGKFDLKELARDSGTSAGDDHPGQFIDILV